MRQVAHTLYGPLITTLIKDIIKVSPWTPHPCPRGLLPAASDILLTYRKQLAIISQHVLITSEGPQRPAAMLPAGQHEVIVKGHVQFCTAAHMPPSLPVAYLKSKKATTGKMMRVQKYSARAPVPAG